METLKSMTGERAMMGRWYNLAEIGTHSQQRLKRINSIAIGLAQSFQQISTISLIIGGYYLFDAGIITMGAIIAIVMLSRSEEHTSELQSLMRIPYAVFCLKKKNTTYTHSSYASSKPT